jgi:methylamine---corrinoid protein Co-methyltransferase
MRNYYTILDRIDNGPWINEENWDLEKVALTTRRLVKKYGLEWNNTEIITTDPQLADAVFKAGFELVAGIGCYCRNTERIVSLSEEELAEGLAAMPRSITVGEGKDARCLVARGVADPRPPTSWGGNPGAPTPENIFLPNVMSYMQEPLIDMITCGTLVNVDGHDVRTESPLEIIATRRELSYLREGLRRSGRPGMGLLAGQSSVSAYGDLAVAQPQYLRPCDAHLVPMLNELKMDMRNIARAVNSIEYGVHNASLACVIVGGLGGSPPGSAVIQAASFIAANLTCLADYHILHPIHVRHVATSTREVLWVINIVSQAFARNAPCVIVSDIYPKSGAGTIELFYETAANALVNTISGGHLEGCGSADGNAPHNSGLEARLMAQVGRAVARQGFTPQEANKLLLQIIPLYEPIFANPQGNPGKPFDQVYDLKTIQPTEEWQHMYEQAVDTLRQLGLKI